MESSSIEITFGETIVDTFGNKLKFVTCPFCSTVIGIEFNGGVYVDRWEHMLKVHKARKDIDYADNRDAEGTGN